MSDDTRVEKMPVEFYRYYADGHEERRLYHGVGQLELIRTQEMILRHFPSPPSTVLDVGGGPGVYAFWLAKQGYEVHLVDSVPLHIEQAIGTSKTAVHSPETVHIGDARSLEQTDQSIDAVLLMGPLYHLTSREDRLRALSEAHRVLRADTGLLFAVGISRFSSLIDGLSRGYFDDPEFVSVVENDLKSGQHRNVSGRVEYFTTTFFHRPEELKAEVQDAGFSVEDIVGLEGPGWILRDFDQNWNDSDYRDRVLRSARVVESEPSLLGMSPHVMVVARKS